LKRRVTRSDAFLTDQSALCQASPFLIFDLGTCDLSWAANHRKGHIQANKVLGKLTAFLELERVTHDGGDRS
jgi:hypothetical protein